MIGVRILRQTNEIKLKNESFSFEKNWYFVAVWFYLIFKILTNMCYRFYDNDIYHILSAGREIYNNGILREDVFFVNPGHKIVIQQWLHNLLTFVIYSNLGKLGLLLVTFIGLIVFISLFLLYFKINKIEFKLSLTAILLIASIASGLFSVRPELVTICFLIIQIILCEIFIRTKKKFFLYFLPLLTLVEINFHATMWIAHFVFLLPYVVPVPLPKKIKSNLKIYDNYISIADIVIPVILMLASLFINPYGIDGILILFRQSEISKLNISELASPHLTTPYAITFIIMLVVALLFFRQINFSSSSIYLFGGTSLMLMMNIRNSYMFYMACLIVLCEIFKSVSLEKLYLELRKVKKLVILLIFAAIAILNLSTALNTPYVALLSENINDRELTPVEAIEYLNKYADTNSRIYTDFNTGSFVSWNNYKIYFSSRTEGYCSKVNGGHDLIGEYLKIYYNLSPECNSDFEEFLSRYDFDYLIVNSNNRMYPYIASNDSYEAVVNGNGYVMFKPV